MNVPKPVWEQWRAIAASVEATARRCSEQPELGIGLGIEPVVDKIPKEQKAIGETGPAMNADYSAWLRGAARRMIDAAEWEYELVQTFGGRVFLTLLRHREKGGDQNGD